MAGRSHTEVVGGGTSSGRPICAEGSTSFYHESQGFFQYSSSLSPHSVTIKSSCNVFAQHLDLRVPAVIVFAAE